MSKQDAGATAIFEAVVGSLQRLRIAGNVSVPSDDLAMRAIRGCLHSRKATWRKSKPQDDESALLWQLVKFHRGNGSLWGFPWFANEQLRDELDTLAVVLLGGQSSAADAWAKALHR